MRLTFRVEEKPKVKTVEEAKVRSAEIAKELLSTERGKRLTPQQRLNEIRQQLIREGFPANF